MDLDDSEIPDREESVRNFWLFNDEYEKTDKKTDVKSIFDLLEKFRCLYFVKYHMKKI